MPFSGWFQGNQPDKNRKCCWVQQGHQPSGPTFWLEPSATFWLGAQVLRHHARVWYFNASRMVYLDLGIHPKWRTSALKPPCCGKCDSFPVHRANMLAGSRKARNRAEAYEGERLGLGLTWGIKLQWNIPRQGLRG